ncbi:YopX family protein [Clostridium perfringens]|uniref:YopX family protein n=1 Tax=Clostridium perfringens TaxID=1502 RepID=UPI0023403AE6|nr:YopX family protein [Clostridium perfringens]MDC4245698.1 YopX family protein [Clostridium perfringens]
MIKREIKFRVWEPLNKNMHSLNFALYENKGHVNHWVLPLNHQCCSDKNYTIMNLNNVEIMQYTGLKDKNGKEIFEGDILERKFKGLGYELGDRTLVSWGEYRYVHIWKMEFERELKNNKDLGRWFKSRKIAELDLDAHIEDFEVIGNIYENPELLSEKELCLI